MLKVWTENAKGGKPVWISEVRKELDEKQEGIRTVLSLTLFSGEKREYLHFLPYYETEDEKRFTAGYLDALIYNLLCAYGGRELAVFYDFSNEKADALFEAVRTDFMAEETIRSGYGKILSESDRVCSFLGYGKFRLVKKDISSYSLPGSAAHSPERETGKEENRITEMLVRAGENACRGVRCGIDIGGSDIKAALSCDGKLRSVFEYDWNPASFQTAEETVGPIVAIAKRLLEENGLNRYDSIGISYPDVVIKDRILGGETPKTMGLREHAADYDKEFAKITALNEALSGICTPGAPIRIINDGNMAAFTSALELAFKGEKESIARGTVAHSLGTSLGTGWVLPDGEVPEYTLEMYDFIIDVGSCVSGRMDPKDFRSTRNENSALQGADRYVGQAAAFRYAYEIRKELLEGFLSENDGVISVGSNGKDLRKPCLEHLMMCAEEGDRAAEQIFRKIGACFARVSEEMSHILNIETQDRFVFGRFVKKKHCFELICEGFSEILPDIRLIPADEDLACSPLMKELAERKDATVAQFGQAAGAICYGAKQARNNIK